MPLPVALAKERLVCRICEEPISMGGQGCPIGWTEAYGEMVFPARITLNFGKEFAHTECLEKFADEIEKKRSERVWTGWDRDVRKISKDLLARYPNSKILFLPDRDDKNAVQEIICELPPNNNRLNQSVAIAMLGRSDLHFHREMVEVYEVLHGRLRVWLGDEPTDLEFCDSLIIPPGTKHKAEAIGTSSTVKVICSPPWKQADHYLVSTPK